MKKKLFLLLLFMLCILTPNVVKADMGPPSIKSYLAIVTTEAGADYYDYENKKEGTLPYNTKIVVNLEMDDGYALFFEGDDVNQLNGKSFLIKIEDISSLNEIYQPSTEEQFTTPIDASILKDEGVYLYNGPSNGYKKTNVYIPKGSKLKLTHGIYSMSAWYYTSYNGVSGWINVLNGAVGFCTKLEKVITINDISLRKINNEKETIPKNTEIDVLYELDNWSKEYYVKYNNTYGYVRIYDVGSKVEVEGIVLSSNLKIYEDINYGTDGNNSKILIDNVPVNTELNIQGFYIPHNSESYIYYVNLNGVSGWLITQKEDVKTSIDINSLLNNYSDFNNYVGNSGQAEDNNQVVINNNNKKHKLNIIDKLSIYIGGAIIFSLTSLVTIILINRKKYKTVTDKNEPKEENKINKKDD